MDLNIIEHQINEICKKSKIEFDYISFIQIIDKTSKLKVNNNRDNSYLCKVCSLEDSFITAEYPIPDVYISQYNDYHICILYNEGFGGYDTRVSAYVLRDFLEDIDYHKYLLLKGL